MAHSVPPLKISAHLKIAIIGLGYVGLPLAVALAKSFSVVGYDLNEERIRELQDHQDRTQEVPAQALSQSSLKVTHHTQELEGCTVFIVTVPTPVDKENHPDLGALRKASETVGKLLRPGALVVYESTVYPGVTEEVCGPLLEKASGLTCGRDFFLGYSPERINPGDQTHRLETITKVVAGQTPEVTETLSEIYGAVNGGNIFKASSIKVAEAAKVIENAQRDINIAFVNEIAMIFSKMGISTREVLAAAQTKWNFLPFSPGLVGGHCIGVDPYYLATWAEKNGHYPKVILSGRHINDHMGLYIASQADRLLHKASQNPRKNRVLILGLTFKENVPDLRNTKVIDIVRYLTRMGHQVDIYDPLANSQEAKELYELDLLPDLLQNKALKEDSEPYDGIIGAVAHEAFQNLSLQGLLATVKPDGILMDLKNLWTHFPSHPEWPKTLQYWSL